MQVAGPAGLLIVTAIATFPFYNCNFSTTIDIYKDDRQVHPAGVAG